jgi:hypothetical protein
MGWEDDLNEGKQANNGEERQGDAQWDARSGREAAFDPHSEADKQRRYQPTPGAKPWRKHVAKHIGERPAPRKDQPDGKDDAGNRKGKGEQRAERRTRCERAAACLATGALPSPFCHRLNLHHHRDDEWATSRLFAKESGN